MAEIPKTVADKIKEMPSEEVRKELQAHRSSGPLRESRDELEGKWVYSFARCISEEEFMRGNYTVSPDVYSQARFIQIMDSHTGETEQKYLERTDPSGMKHLPVRRWETRWELVGDER